MEGESREVDISHREGFDTVNGLKARDGVEMSRASWMVGKPHTSNDTASGTISGRNEASVSDAPVTSGPCHDSDESWVEVAFFRFEPELTS